MLTSEGIRYSWEQICQRVGLSTQFSQEDIVLHYQDFNIGIDSDKLNISIFQAPEEQWHDLLVQLEGTLEWVDVEALMPARCTTRILGKIPILFPRSEEIAPRRLIEYNQEQNTLIINFDIIAATYIMLTRWEETILTERDQHGRFPATAGIAYRQGFLSRPVVDEYAVILREWLRTILPGLPVIIHDFRIQVSHDIDHLGKSDRPIFNGVKMLKDYAVHRDVEIFLADARHFAAGHGITPNTWSALQLVKWAVEFNYQPIFYLMAANKGSFDEGYDLETPDCFGLIRTITQAGFEIGLHAGYETMLNINTMNREKERLEKAVRLPVTRIRQHYLRAQTPDTWRIWQETGFLRDSSLCYSDAAGFRCGTCHPYKLFDIEQDREMDVTEEALIVMDTTLFGKLKYPFAEAEKEILLLAANCRTVGGVFCLLWHNTSLIHTRHHWGQFYYRLIPRLLEF
jgi:hypothetical protein